MLLVYIACLAFGGILLLMSMAGGDSADHDVSGHADVGHDLAAHADTGHDLAAHADAGHDLAAHADAGHDLAAHADAGIDATESAERLPAHQSRAGDAEAVRFLSFRNFVFFMAFFGLTGTVMTLLAMPSLITGVASAGLGLFASHIGHRLLRYLKGSETGQMVHLHDLKGHTARVTVACSRSRTGKIAVRAGSQTHTLLALVAPEERRTQFHIGDSVIISRVEEGVARVIDARLLEDHPPEQLT